MLTLIYLTCWPRIVSYLSSAFKIKLWKITKVSMIIGLVNVKTNAVSFIMAEHNKDYNCEMRQTLC